MSIIDVVIPCRKGSDAKITLASLALQTLRQFRIIMIVDEEGKGAPWARNRGFEKTEAPFVLFSDDDIDWRPTALQVLFDTLIAHPDSAYSYGSYKLGNLVFCDRDFDPIALREFNYISTMSLIRRERFPGFDESLRRFQDWDLWLTLLDQGQTGIYCRQLIFKTYLREGISFGRKTIKPKEAMAIVKAKHSQPSIESSQR